MSTFKVASYNAAYFQNAKSGAKADYYILFEEADVVGFQEAGRSIDEQQIKAVAVEKNFGTFFSDNEEGCPIAWNKAKFEFLDSGSKFLSPRTFVGDAGAGPDTMGEKNHPWVKLRHKESGRIIYFGTAHLTPSIYLAARRRLHIRQTNAIRDWIEGTKNQLVTVGDYNIDAKEDSRERDPQMPFVKFRRVNVVSTYASLGYPGKGTHGERHIDYVWFRNSGVLKPISHRLRGGLSSDHKALIATFEVKPVPRKRITNSLKRVVGK